MPFEELDYASTPIGEISLRKRYDRLTRRWVHEVRLGDEYLMSSQFNASEIALARLGLAEAHGAELRVLVAGLGLGFTAHEALRDPRIAHLSVIELVGAVIDWHRRDLIPDTTGLATDPRCELIEADFFDLLRSGGCTPVDVMLVDIDHSPDNLLSPAHSDFYEVTGLQRAADAMTSHGVLALWSDDAPDDRVLERLRVTFALARAEIVDFDNPITGSTSSCTVYVATQPHRLR
ncbi:spermidine synthase [Nocardioides sp.]|uniref:spermidine synthase n=1 Tax=Nocardioides sp. TaxID=35761 RepID=UPI002734D606|nr:spermidine synthase [Nocardioides sp.]MDP3894988.1 spermidine synthase [Nocardioides sp.]